MLSATLTAAGQVQHSKEETKIGIELKAKVDGTEVKGEFKSKKACTESSCYQFKLEVGAGFGVGMEIGAGYNKNIETRDTLTFSAGLGFIPALRAKITVEKEPNQLTVENNSKSIPRPS